MSKSRCFAESTAEDQLSDSEARVAGDIDVEEKDKSSDVKIDHFSVSNISKTNNSPSSDLLSLGIPEPVYQVCSFSCVCCL